MQAVFNAPVLADIAQEIRWSYLLGIEATHVIARIVQYDFTIAGAQFPIDTQANLATWQIERFSDVIGVV